jgi:hypothetical protein
MNEVVPRKVTESVYAALHDLAVVSGRREEA